MDVVAADDEHERPFAGGQEKDECLVRAQQPAHDVGGCGRVAQQPRVARERRLEAFLVQLGLTVRVAVLGAEAILRARAPFLRRREELLRERHAERIALLLGVLQRADGRGDRRVAGRHARGHRLQARWVTVLRGVWAAAKASATSAARCSAGPLALASTAAWICATMTLGRTLSTIHQCFDVMAPACRNAATAFAWSPWARWTRPISTHERATRGVPRT